MKAHLRARVFQAGAFLALIGGAVVAMPPAAHAAPPTLSEVRLTPSANLKAGDRPTLSFKVTNPNSNATDFSIEIRRTINEVRCEGDVCNTGGVRINGGASQTFQVRLVGDSIAAGESKSGQVLITVRTQSGETGSANVPITLVGSVSNPTVREVAGKVRDQNGKAVANAQVGLLDSANRSYATNTNGSGNFKFVSTDQQPIAPGTVVIGARKDGYKTDARPLTVNAKAGASLNVSLTLPTEAEPTPTATPEASASATAEADTLATDDATTAPAVEPVNASGDGDEGGSMAYIIIGVLLVAAGIGAIVLVLMRRKDGETEPDPLAGPPGAHAAVPVAPRQGRYGGAPADATRIVNRDADATRVGAVPARPSMSDAPTVLHRPVPADEFPDPYGAPAAGVGAAAGGWGAPADNYPPANQYGQPQPPGGGYGAPAYGQPSSGAGYGAAAPQATGYGAAPQGGGYGAAAPQGGGYGAASQGYGAAAPQGGAYGAAAPQGGYGAPAPQQGGGFGAADGQRYDEPTGRYDPAAGYRGDPGYDQGSGYPQAGGYSAPVSGQPGDRGAPAGPSGFRPAAPTSGYPAADSGYPQAGRQQPGSGAPYQAGGYETGGYQAPQSGGYQTGGYQAGGYSQHPTSGSAAGGYAPEQAGTYGSWNPGGGIDSGNAYGAPAGNYGRSGGYNPPPATGGGYDEPTGYEPGGYQPAGYQPRSTYGQQDSYRAPEQPPSRAPQAPVSPPQQGGYGNAGYYGAEQPQAGRRGGQANPNQPEPPGQRRSLDWLDD
ncbi:MAG TPA: carboxypeptidase regulatory-like domain-containing protein [Actinoplanes sp.]|nr:carboxypeptidase regulatory-like domain-containing protein [Actinoplanes sp.]